MSDNQYRLNRKHKIELSKYEYQYLLEYLEAMKNIFLQCKVHPARLGDVIDVIQAIRANTYEIEQPIQCKEIIIDKDTVKAALPETGYLRQAQVLRLIPVGKSTWWNGIKSGRFPKGVNLGGRVTAWKVEDIRELIEKLNNQ